MLTDLKIKSAKSKDKPYKIADTNRLYVLVSAKGTKTFRLDYNLDGKAKTLTIGNYPEITLSEAREKANEARKQIKRGVSPDLKNAKHQAFKAIADEFIKIKEWDEKHKQTRRLILYVFPKIGNANINELEAPDILAIVRAIENNGTGETAHRVLNLVGQIFRYAVQCGYAKYDVTSSMKGALKPIKKGHFRAIIAPDEIRQAYKSLELVPSIITRNALKMTLLCAMRPKELRFMKWEEIKLDKAEWRFHATKTKTDHITPLSKQATSVLQEMAGFTGRNVYVFPSMRECEEERPLSNTALLMALQRAGIDSTAHGFRASFRTISDEILDFAPHHLEQQLGHMVKDTHGRAYNRTTHLIQRREILQAWADFLDG